MIAVCAGCFAFLDMTNIPVFVGESRDVESLCCNFLHLIVYPLLFWSVEGRLEVFWNEEGVWLLTQCKIRV